MRFPDDGVEIDGSAAWNNTIGKEAGGGRNVIGANGQNGIRISNGASRNTVGSNFIGLDVPSWAALPNGENGVAIQDGASYNLVGAATATASRVELAPWQHHLRERQGWREHLGRRRHQQHGAR